MKSAQEQVGNRVAPRPILPESISRFTQLIPTENTGMEIGLNAIETWKLRQGFAQLIDEVSSLNRVMEAALSAIPELEYDVKKLQAEWPETYSDSEAYRVLINLREAIAAVRK